MYARKYSGFFDSDGGNKDLYVLVGHRDAEVTTFTVY